MSQTVTDTTTESDRIDPEVLEPVRPDEAEELHYTLDDEDIPPWVVAEPIPHDELPDDLNPADDATVYGYDANAGPALVNAVMEIYGDRVTMPELMETNNWVRDENGAAIEQAVVDDDTDLSAEPFLAEMETIMRFVVTIVDDDAEGDPELIPEFIEGWDEGGHRGLERVYFRHDTTKMTVALALDAIRDELLAASDVSEDDWEPYRPTDDPLVP